LTGATVMAFRLDDKPSQLLILIEVCLLKISELAKQLKMDPGKPNADIYIIHNELAKLARDLTQTHQQYVDNANDKTISPNYLKELEKILMSDLNLKFSQVYIDALVEDSTVVNGKPVERKNALAPKIEAIILAAANTNPVLKKILLPSSYNNKENFEPQFLSNINSVYGNYFAGQVAEQASTNYCLAITNTRENIKDIHSAKCAKAMEIASKLNPVILRQYNEIIENDFAPNQLKVQPLEKSKLTFAKLFSQVTSWIKQKLWGDKAESYLAAKLDMHREALKTSYPTNAKPTAAEPGSPISFLKEMQKKYKIEPVPEVEQQDKVPKKKL
jgi:hypothetical protein